MKDMKSTLGPSSLGTYGYIFHISSQLPLRLKILNLRSISFGYSMSPWTETARFSQKSDAELQTSHPEHHYEKIHA
jgi:hypothetical protein